MSTQRARLLVVDDDDDLRTTLPLILTGAGYKVRSASDGVSALAEIRNEIPEILISDLNMPGMSGFDLLEVVRRSYPSIGVVAMSSAFSGLAIPPGVAADIFYEKTSGVPALLRMVKRMESARLGARLPPALADASREASTPQPSISSF